MYKNYWTKSETPDKPQGPKIMQLTLLFNNINEKTKMPSYLTFKIGQTNGGPKFGPKVLRVIESWTGSVTF